MQGKPENVSTERLWMRDQVLGIPPRRMRRDRGFASWLEGVSATLQYVFAAVWFVLHELMLPRPHSLEHA